MATDIEDGKLLKNIAKSAAPQQIGKIPHNECPRYDTKQSNGEIPVMLELWGMRSIPFIAIVRRSTLA